MSWHMFDSRRVLLSCLALTLATLVGALQFSGIGGLLPVWVALVIGQMLEGMVVTPWLVGDLIGLHPLAMIFALMAFGQLFGFFGVLLALPASAVLLVGCGIRLLVYESISQVAAPMRFPGNDKSVILMLVSLSGRCFAGKSRECWACDPAASQQQPTMGKGFYL